MKYFLLGIGLLFLTACSMSMEEVEQRVNSCRAVGGEPVITKHQRTDMAAFVQCRKDGVIYSNWKGKDK